MADPEVTAGGTGGNGGGSPGGEPAGERMFTQAELDRHIADRLKRAKPEVPSDYETLKAAAAKLAEIEAKDQSEAQKLQAKLDAQAAALAERDQKLAERDESIRRRDIRDAIRSEATKQGALDPDTVLALVMQDNTVTVGDDGQVIGAKDAVKGTLAAKQFLVGQTPTPRPGSGDGGARPGNPNAGSLDEQIAAASKAGDHKRVIRLQNQKLQAPVGAS